MASKSPLLVNAAGRNADNEIVLAPLRASAGLELWYREKLQALVQEMAQSMLLHISAVYRRRAPTIGFAADDSPTVALRRALEKWGRRWTKNLEAASDEIARMFAARSRRNLDLRMAKILKDVGFTVTFRPTTAMREAYRAVAAEQVNLIRSIPQQFLKDVRSAVWASVMKGGSLGELSTQLRQRYRVSYRRAALIARDQTNKARAIMEEARRSELGIEEAIWHHSHAGKVPRPTHVRMHNKRYKIKQGMWDSAVGKYVWPGTEPNCFPENSLIFFADGVRVAYRRLYRGKLAVLTTDSGKVLRATPNHPVLTSKGWIAVQSLQKGDDVWEVANDCIGAEALGAAPSGLRERDVHDAVPTISEVFLTLRSALHIVASKRMGGEEFHGDAVPNSDVDIIFAARPLTFGGKLPRNQRGEKFLLPDSDIFGSGVGLTKELDCARSRSAPRDVSRSRDTFALRGRRITHPLEHGGAAPADRSAGMFDTYDYRVSGNTMLAGQREYRHTGLVLPSQLATVVGVEFVEFEGHVYNLETSNGWYIADGIITHNCRCTSRAIIGELRSV